MCWCWGMWWWWWWPGVTQHRNEYIYQRVSAFMIHGRGHVFTVTWYENRFALFVIILWIFRNLIEQDLLHMFTVPNTTLTIQRNTKQTSGLKRHNQFPQNVVCHFRHPPSSYFCRMWFRCLPKKKDIYNKHICINNYCAIYTQYHMHICGPMHL